jgi:hypothetical protein
LSLGTYIFGRCATIEEARVLADVLYKTNPYVVKEFRRIRFSGGNTRNGKYQPLEVYKEDPEFMSLSEQWELNAQKLTQLGLFQFLCRPAIQEGEVSTSVIPMTIENIDRDPETGEYQFPNYERVSQVRAALESQSGIPVDTLLQEQENRLLAAAIRRTPAPPQDGNERQASRRPQQAGETRHTSTTATPASRLTRQEKDSLPDVAPTPTPPTQRRYPISEDGA